MLHSKKIKILFWIKKRGKTQGKVMLYLRLTVNSRRIVISLNRKVDISKWSTKQQRVKNNHPQAQQINSFLTSLETKIHNHQIKMDHEGKLVTCMSIKSNLFGEDEQLPTLKKLFEYHSLKMENILAKGTLKNYGTTE